MFQAAVSNLNTVMNVQNIFPVMNQGYGSTWHDRGMGDHMFGWGWDMMLIMTLFWIAVIIGAIFIVRWIVYQSRGQQGRTSALEILKIRYAKGEISKEEFEEKKKDLL